PHAIVTGERELGRIGFGALEDGRIFLEGRSRVGEAMTPPLIRALLRKASACAAREKADLLIDAPPGVSCPVMTAAASADAVVLVIDPTPFGVHDFKLALRAFESLGKPMAAVINRSGQPSAAACEAELIAFCGEKGLPVAARLPFDREAAARAAAGRHPMLDSEDWRECLSEAARTLSTLFEGGRHA
ncbi:MAG: (4Fe-4S)-binding protein, partial [Sutterella wadsworthensis]